MDPILSVVITAFNEGDLIIETVRSVQRQTFAFWEIILVDDGSSGRTQEVVASLVDEPGVRVVRQVNQGVSAARNYGLKLARGRYVGFLDGDDLWYPDKAASHIAILETHPPVDLTFSWWRYVDEQGHDTGRRGKPDKKSIQLEDFIKQNFIGSPSNVIGRREALFEAGLFDPNLLEMADMEFWFRVGRLREGNIRCVPEVLLDYRVRRGQLTKNWRRVLQDWERVMDKVRQMEPQRMAAVEYEAYAIAKRYLAYLAYVAEDYPVARRFLFEALQKKPGFLLDGGSFFTIMAILCTYLPKTLHQSLANWVQDRRLNVRRREDLRS
jgi:glycosyltransferase involved in cell wall biosynthesis